MGLRQAFDRAFGSTDFWLWMFVYAGVWCKGGDIPCCRSTAAVSCAIAVLALFHCVSLCLKWFLQSFRLPDRETETEMREEEI